MTDSVDVTGSFNSVEYTMIISFSWLYRMEKKKQKTKTLWKLFHIHKYKFLIQALNSPESYTMDPPSIQSVAVNDTS